MWIVFLGMLWSSILLAAPTNITLETQHAELPALLSFIAEQAGKNIVIGEGVTGTVSVHLKDVPWQEALQILLKTHGLAMKETPHALIIAPAKQMAEHDKTTLEALQQAEALTPLQTELFQIHHAKADEMARFLKAEKNSLLSSRGHVVSDPRSNSLLIQDIPTKLTEITSVIALLDKPAQQVLIESRVVIANDDFGRELGFRFGATTNPGKVALSGSLEATQALLLGNSAQSIKLADRLNFNLPAPAPSGRFGLSIGKLPGGTLLDLELSALEQEGRVEIISRPQLLTTNQHAALIESGEEIPFRQTVSQGSSVEVTIEFKKAVLALEVTPQITPDKHVLMDLKVKQDARGALTEAGPAIDTQNLQTRVLVADGETVVLGGVYRHTQMNDNFRIPGIHRLPWIGELFKKSSTLRKKQELLVFVTPKIIHASSTGTSP